MHMSKKMDVCTAMRTHTHTPHTFHIAQLHLPRGPGGNATPAVKDTPCDQMALLNNILHGKAPGFPEKC